MEPIKALIIDDEALGRKIIVEFLSSHPEVEVLAECGDSRQALEAIEKYNPDLLFLDIQMPEINGFELLDMLPKIPFIIFSTAYDRYALKAFEVNAVDYLLKPYDQERFDRALERVKDRIWKEKSLAVERDRIQKLLQHWRAEKPYLSRILARKAGKYVILNVDDIVWIEAMGDYINLHTAHDSFLILHSLNEMEERLDPGHFIRAHRTSLVRLDAISEIVPWTNGRLKVRLTGGQEIMSSRSGAQRLKKLMA